MASLKGFLMDPSYDSVDHWAHIAGRVSGAPRDTIVFAASGDTATIRSGNYKLIHHALNATYFHTWFNGTANSYPWKCNSNEMVSLFYDVVADPHERDDLTHDPAYAEKRAELTAIWLDAWENEYWVPTFPFDTLSTGAPDAAHADRAIHANGGYVTHWGCEANLRDR